MNLENHFTFSFSNDFYSLSAILANIGGTTAKAKMDITIKITATGGVIHKRQKSAF
jgi:hypothetical protein